MSSSLSMKLTSLQANCIVAALRSLLVCRLLWRADLSAAVLVVLVVVMVVAWHCIAEQRVECMDCCMQCF